MAVDMPKGVYERNPPPLMDRFWKYVSPEPNSGCWLWDGSLNAAGYGQINDRTTVFRAHRISYEAINGPIPHGLELDHKCRIRCCVNPDHLEPVSHAENVRRGEAGLRSARRATSRTHCAKGHERNSQNTHYANDGRRVCRVCAAAATKRYRAKKGTSA